MKLLLEVKDLTKDMAKTLGEMRADHDLKTKGMMANSSNITPPASPVSHTPSTTLLTIPQPSYNSVSTQTTPLVVHQPSYVSISV